MLTPEVINTLIGAIVGSLLGAGVPFLLGRFSKQRETVIELYHEYNGQDLMRDRMLTSDFLKNSINRGYRDYWDAFSDSSVDSLGQVTREQFEAFRRVSLFFEKVYIFKKNGYLNRKLARSMLGIYVCGWARNGWLDFLERSKAEKSETFRYRREHFLELYDWFKCDKRMD